MKSFHFPLQRVLEWRAVQVRKEEEALATLQGKLAGIVRDETALAAAQRNAEMELLGQTVAAGSEFRALAAFQLRIRGQKISLAANRKNYEAQIADRLKLLLKARKDYKVVETLKERRKTAWVYRNDQEVENIAAESYISSWVRSNAENRG